MPPRDGELGPGFDEIREVRDGSLVVAGMQQDAAEQDLERRRGWFDEQRALHVQQRFFAFARADVIPRGVGRERRWSSD